MVEQPSSPSTDDEFLGRIRVGRALGSLSDLVALSAAALLGLLFVAQSEPSFVPGMKGLIAGAIVIAVLAVSTLNILELLGGSAEGSGSYALVHETVPGVASFLTGWAVLAASALASGALTRMSASIIERWTGSAASSVGSIAVALLLLIMVAHMVRWGRWRSLPRLLLFVSAFGLAATLVSVSFGGSWGPGAASTQTRPGVLGLAARYSLVFLGVETLILSRRSVRNARSSLPRAFGVALMLALLAVGLPGVFMMRIEGVPPGSLLDAIRSASRLPDVLVDLSVLAGLVLALSTLFMNGVRTINSMTRRGALPAGLRGAVTPFAIPPGLFLAMGAATLAALAVGSESLDASLASWSVLSALVFVTMAAFISRRTEPDRRRWIRLPLFPLVPAVGLAGLLALLFHLPTTTHVLGVGWNIMGVMVYLLYARQNQVRAQEGIVTFGTEIAAERPEDGYRLLVPLGEQEARRFALDLSVALAKQLNGDVMPLQVIPIPDPLAVEEGRRLAQERNTLFQWSLRRGLEAGVPVSPVTRLARSVADGIVDTAIEEHCDLVLLPWAIEDTEVEQSMGTIVDEVAMRTPCDLAIVGYRPGQLEEQVESNGDQPSARHAIKTILVPTSGGPHAPLAVGLALELAEEFGAQVRSVYVGGQGLSENARREGEDRIRSTLDAMRSEAAEILRQDLQKFEITTDQVEKQVVEAADVVDGIVRASGDADLTFIGSSEESFIDQVLFGSIPRQVAARSLSPVVMVRRHRGLPQFWLGRLWDTIAGSLPTLAPQDQIEVYKRIRRGARPDVDFFVMIGLSALIATLGLLLDSGAVIIGAMLVAPLFTPVLAFSMAIASGDVRVLRLASEATLKGASLAIGLALLVALLVPLGAEPLTSPEIAARVQPNLLDLGVALASGAAGAYAIARKDVAASLPGVAIAAALVPPLGVVGIALSAGSVSAALGAALLVITNLIAISLSGALVLLMLGFRPGQRGERMARFRTGLVASLALLALVSVPLGLVLLRTVRASRLEQLVHTTLESEASGLGIPIEVVETELQEVGDMLTVTATIYVPGSAQEPPVDQLGDAIARVTGRSVNLRLLALPVLESHGDP